MNKIIFGWKITFLLILSSVPMHALAKDYIEYGEISYSNFSIFAHQGEGVLDADFGGWIARGSYALSDHFFVLGDYASQRTTDEINLGSSLADRVQTKQGHLGLGFHTPIFHQTDFVISAQYAVAIVEFLGDSDTSEGYLIDAGVRSTILDRWELALVSNYSSHLSQGDFGYSASARYFLRPELSVGLRFESVFDVEAYGVVFRYDI